MAMKATERFRIDGPDVVDAEASLDASTSPHGSKKADVKDALEEAPKDLFVTPLEELSLRHTLRFDKNALYLSPVHSQAAFFYSSNRPAWTAEILFYVVDLPRLMRADFTWDEKNVVPRYNCFIRTCAWNAEFCPKAKNQCARRYLLTDLAGKPLWTACLVVTAAEDDLGVISRFRVSDLTADRLTACVAREGESMVYQHKPSYPEKSINAIYDDMPMKGKWPWPKGPIKG